MTDLTLELLAQRMTRLERQNRLLKLGALVVVAVLASALWIGAATKPKTIEAEQFVVRDAKGTTRIVLGLQKGDTAVALPEGDPGLEVYDDKGKKSLVAHVTVLGPTFAVFDAEGKERASLDYDRMLGVPRVVLWDETNEAGIILSNIRDEFMLRTWKPGGNRVKLGHNKDGAFIQLFDPGQGKPIWSAP